MTPHEEPARAREASPSILYVTATFPTVAWFLESEVADLLARGFRVRVVTLRGSDATPHPEHAALRAITSPIGSPFAWRSWVSLIGWLARRPRVLIAETFRILWASRRSLYALAGHVGYLPAAAAVASRVEREKFECVHGAWAHFPATVAYLAARLTGRRFTMAGHAGADLHRSQAFLAEKARAADFVLCCVRGNARMLRRMTAGHARIEWVPHGVELARFVPGRPRKAAQPLLLAGGRLSPEKGLDLAIRALAELARRGHCARLVLFGDGPSRGSLEALARRAGVRELVEFTGAIPRDRLCDLYRSAWILVSPCRVLANGRRDGVPNVLVEALAMGLPCVGTPVGGIEEAIRHDRTGLLCEPESVVSLADALERLIRSPAERERMGVEARRHAEQCFDSRRSAERVAGLFQEAARLARAAPRLRVLHVMEAMRMGGAETVVVEHVRHADSSYDVAVCALNGGGEALERARLLGARVFDLGERRAPGPLRPLLRLVRLARLMRRERIDIVNAHNPTGALYGVLAARLAGVPVIVRTEHSVHDPTRHSRVYLALEPLITAWSRRIVCVSEVVRESHRRRLPGYGERFVTVRNGVSDAAPLRSRPEVRAALTLQDDAPVLLAVGSLTPHKAQHVLLDAFAAVKRRHGRARLLVAGEGPLRRSLEEHADRLGVASAVRFLGARDDVPDLMAAADAMASSSTREGLPISILEAMRAGRAVVATDAGGVREVVTHGATGLVVPPEDPWALAAALEELVADPEKARAMGAQAHVRWERDFAAERMVRETERAYGVTPAPEESLVLD